MKFTSFYCGKNQMFDTEIDHFYAGRCGSGTSWFGEEVKLARATATQLVFRGEDSGAEVRTKRDNLHRVLGKAAKCGYSISVRKDPIVWGENDEYKSPIML